MDDLIAAIERLAGLLADRRTRDVEDACDMAFDRLCEREDIESTSPRGRELEAIFDGIRFAHRASIAVERKGGAMVRLLLPCGVAMTLEWGGPLAEGREAEINARFGELLDWFAQPDSP